MKNKKTFKPVLEQPSSPTFENTMGDYQKPWITDYAWISGVSGALMVLVLAAWFNASQTLDKGLHLFGNQLTDNRNQTALAALLIVTLSMVLVECVRLWLWDPKNFFRLHPKLKSGNYPGFLAECIANYLLYLLVLWFVVQFYYTANEYGFKQQDGYYQIWFMFINWVWSAWLYAGLPYVILTRALKYDADSDVRDYGFYCARLLLWPVAKVVGKVEEKYRLTDVDKKITRGLMVKLFFTPIMTVFFIDNFPHLVSNIGYLLSDNGISDAIAKGNYDNNRLNNDLYNISTSLIFSIDVALAWCGYVISSRWVDNQTISAEPTMLGWAVCLLCYPPLRVAPGWLYGFPGEKEAIYLFDAQWVITFFLILALASYFVYMLATLWFGTRFSNLTHRGIIRKGPFAIVRHPAYASKNFSWWCIIFPAIIYNAFHSHFAPAILGCMGLALSTYIYYWRAITEERHLSADPAYHDYCKHVKYRFIPGVI